MLENMKIGQAKVITADNKALMDVVSKHRKAMAKIKQELEAIHKDLNHQLPTAAKEPTVANVQKHFGQILSSMNEIDIDFHDMIKSLEKAPKESLGAQVVQYAEAYNNTMAWEHGGSVFVDSLKYPRVFLQALEKEFGLKGKVLHENKDHDIGMGEGTSDLEFGGRKTMCNVIEFPLHGK